MKQKDAKVCYEIDTYAGCRQCKQIIFFPMGSQSLQGYGLEHLAVKGKSAT